MPLYLLAETQKRELLRNMSSFVFTPAAWPELSVGQSREWSVQNGAGGYAGSSLVLAPARRHHGLLVASLTPPVRRQMVWTRCEEALRADGDGAPTRLDSVCYENETVDACAALQRFVWDGLPHWTYRVPSGGIEVRRVLAMQREANASALGYTVCTGAQPARLTLTPRLCWREAGAGYQDTADAFRFRPELQETRGEREVLLYPQAAPGLRVRFGWEVKIPSGPKDGAKIAAELLPAPELSAPILLRTEAETGNPAPERDAAFFRLQITLPAHCRARVSLTCALEAADAAAAPLPNAFALERAERARQAQLVANMAADPTTRRLVRAADQFLVRRQSTGGMTMLAGLPWFTDWGRDTMIAFEGNCLCTGRFAEARSILQTFACYEKNGLVPNMFPDEGNAPLYNTVDASLWYLCAAALYLQYTGGEADYAFVQQALWPCMQSILHHYEAGTEFSIGMDPADGLLHAGGGVDQVTWMDVRVGDWVPTPRHGKPVEINALWYTALCIGQSLAARFGCEADAAHWAQLAARVRARYAAAFWVDASGGYLCDCIDPSGAQDKTLRPNQLLAVSLRRCLPVGAPPLLAPEQERSLVKVCKMRLLAGPGVRTLPPDDPNYHGKYIGPLAQRDAAYHQGTAWGWLTGEFLLAHAYAFGFPQEDPAQRAVLRRLAQPAVDSMRTGGIGSIAEIFDADAPHIGRGCFAQAWSIGTLLAAWTRLGLGEPPRH
jgi:hypothetical protein